MKDLIISDDHSTYISKYNEIQKTLTEKEISKGIYYDAAHMRVFEDKQEPGTYSREELDIEKK